MSNFKARKAKGEILQKKVLKYLDHIGLNYIITGYEYLQGSSSSMKIITRNQDSTSLFVRHYPDITLVYENGSCLIEVKHSSGIEKNCYHNYLKLHTDLNLHVLLVLQYKDSDPVVCKIQDLKFSKRNTYDYTSEMNIPVTDGIWAEPRLMDEYSYMEYLRRYRRKGKNTSGSSFAFIDFANTKTYPLSILKSFKK